MGLQRPLILKDGKVQRLDPLVDEIEGAPDFLSGKDLVEDGKIFLIPENFQSINFTSLTIDGDLYLEGDLWLA